MRILFLCHAFNSLTQRLYVELNDQGYQVSVEFDINDRVTEEAVILFRPDLVIAPFLKRAIPDSIWRHHVCLVVHPGIKGDRGPSALDWAILEGERDWGVTVLQANREMDAGDIWASEGFPMRDATKASLYRNEVTEAAVSAVIRAVNRFEQGGYKPRPLDYGDNSIRGRLRTPMKQRDRAIDWQRDKTDQVLRKIRSADGFPGVLDQLCGRALYLFDARPESKLRGEPGSLIARSGPAICRATVDGAVWIGHLLDKNSAHPFKLPATCVLEKELSDLEETPDGYEEVWYQEQGKVGFLYFDFYNGAMSTDQCERLCQAYLEAKQRDTRVIVLMGGQDYWSNGMHLNLIEAADSPADESWRNINALDDLALEIINTEQQITVSALRGNAGAGGVFLARAADRVWARDGVVLNPHYKDMGNLYGSEYWTCLLPYYAGEENAHRISQSRLPMGVDEGKTLGLLDRICSREPDIFLGEVASLAGELAQSEAIEALLSEKHARHRIIESEKPLSQYRAEELEKMRLNFYGFDPSYHVARYNFVYKVPKSRTPLTIAQHRLTHNR